GDQAQLRLDAGPPRLPHPDRPAVLLRAAPGDAAVTPAGRGRRPQAGHPAAAWLTVLTFGRARPDSPCCAEPGEAFSWRGPGSSTLCRDGPGRWRSRRGGTLS